MFNIQGFIIAVVTAFTVGASSSWYLTAEYKDNKWEVAIAKQRQKAADRLQRATETVVTVERQQVKLATELEKAYVQQQQNLDKTLWDNRLSSEQRGLWDPGARGGCGDAVPTGSPTTGSTVDRPPCNRLSGEAVAFLLRYAREADSAAQYANLCHNWIREIED